LEKCFDLIESGKGKDFDPLVVEVFLDSKEKIEILYKELIER